jgi:hypothetical protein
MSSNAFMLPALPQLPAPGLKGPDGRAPAAFKSDRIVRPTDQNSSFAATLKRISDRYHGSNPKATPAAKPAATSRRADVQSPNPQKLGKTNAAAPDAIEENEPPLSSLSAKTAPSHHMRQAFDWMAYHLMNLSLADDGTLAVQPLSDSDAGTRLFMPGDWIGYLQLQGQQVQGEPLGIGPFEQLQFNISLEAIHRFFFEQLAFRAADPQDGGGQPDEAVRFFGFRQWMLPSAALAATETLNGQIESTGVNGNPLLHLPAMGMPVTALGFNTETGSSSGLHNAVGPEMAQFNADLLKMAASSQTAEAGISEGAKTTVADPEAQARQLNATFQPLKIQATLQAVAEQPANPNSTAEGITAKTPEEVFNIKSAALKDGITPGDVLGNKWVQVDGDSKDSGFLFSQDQMPQHLARLENAAHSTEATQRSLTPQTLDQIVQKAVLSLNNGQHEVQIELKPDFLGHIRMQIVSEGHQVAIKIVAELPFVKDMLENNLHQLKADLQAQGLDIDELEVSVAHDSHEEADTRQSAENAKVQAVRGFTDLDDGPSEKPGQSQSQGGGATSETAVDFFA